MRLRAGKGSEKRVDRGAGTAGRTATIATRKAAERQRKGERDNEWDLNFEFYIFVNGCLLCVAVSGCTFVFIFAQAVDAICTSSERIIR